MRNRIILLIMLTTGLFSCGQSNDSTPDSVLVVPAKLELREIVNSQNSVNNDKYIDTKYVYADSIGNELIIQNSLPKGGLKYRGINGNDYTYAIFWISITNETVKPLELKINFPVDSFELPSSVGNYFKIFIPSVTMTADKKQEFNYGLTNLESLLDNNLGKSSSLHKILNPKDLTSFYIVTLFDQGVEGAVRAGIKLKEQDLIFNINNKEINCGTIYFK